ncbi:MAG TPA: hypothetical protein VEI01_18295 [Terriglobales bacterium]|nr:hypothetical protein [Terriglobales bacterium]
MIPSARLALLLVLCSGPLALAQRKEDPLTPAEIDQLRDTALEPEPRMKLYVEFARARLVALEQMRADPKVTDRGQKTHAALQEFLSVYDELNDNLDNFEDRKADLRKALKFIIAGDTQFESELRALKNDASAPRDEVKKYEFLLSDAIETVDMSAEDHRKLLSEQEEAAKHKKKPSKE